MRRTLIATVMALSTVAAGATGGAADSAADSTAGGATGGTVNSAASNTARGTVSGSAPAAAVPGFDVIGLTDNQRLVGFEIRSPGRVRDLGRVNGLVGDTALVGIDYRVQNGRLYGVGNQGGVYTLSGPATAAKVSQLTVPLSGTAFGVDFNPAANRLRVISANGQNLRHNLDDPVGTPAVGQTVADAALVTPSPSPGVPGTVVTGVLGAGYTNNDLSPATGTTLFDVDTTADRVLLQSPANAGVVVPTGNLRVDATGAAGFDVYSSLRNGVTVSNSAFASLRVAGRYRFYGVNLLTGGVNYNYGAFPANRQVIDIALRLDR
ncbi:DUF4394 domain-containing protein [Streptosporangium sp. NPDC002721]|uniref:DUF4394 domain-containing protein n=1 Tax=Streptosporangium sp. NPDC002721 TaxID=3366188 RepID=UPI00368891E4